MRRLLTYAVLSATLLFGSSLDAQNTPLPYFCGFEDDGDISGWTLKSRPDLTSEWYIGKAVARNGKKSLYISPDKGNTASYTETTTGYYIVAYKKFTLPAGAYDLTLDYKVMGEMSNEKEAFDAMKVAWVPAEEEPDPKAGSFGRFPSYTSKYGVIFSGADKELVNSPQWATLTGEVKVSGSSGEYLLILVWKTNGGIAAISPGACVDNIQLGISRKGECADIPRNLKETKDASTGEKTVSWDGNAQEYELRYFGKDINRNPYDVTVKNITSTSYTFRFNDIPEGVYSVKVRAICGQDTSLWNGLSDILVYNPAVHCIDYIGFENRNTVSTAGNFRNPYLDTAAVDKGFNSMFSIHTAHYDLDETDIRTGNELKTVPDGAIASARLSNWVEGTSISGSLSYTYKVSEDADIMKIRYAAVLQYQEMHPENGQTRIIVEIMDAGTETLLSECTYSDFNAKQVHQDDGLRKWHKYVPPAYLVSDNTCPIMWCDWTTIGINLGEYVGRTLKIRITMKACESDYHFAYAYFVLDCGKGEIDGVTCGEHPEVFRVPEGFFYEWYRTHDPDRKIVGTADSLVIGPNDTSTYSVDLIFPENDNCYFTLKASALPRKPVAGAEYGIQSENCVNTVHFNNLSKVYGFWKGDTIDRNETCGAYEWDFGRYGKSADENPAITVPAGGDTFNVRLTAYIDGQKLCGDDTVFTVALPSIAVNDTTDISYSVCPGDTVRHDGETYSTEGDFMRVYKSAAGCDSVVMIQVKFVRTDTVAVSSSICKGEKYDFRGSQLTESGHYADTVRSKNGCDSIIHTLDLTVIPSLSVSLSDNSIEACADDGSLDVEYTLDDGLPGGYGITFDTAAVAAGLSDIDSASVPDDGIISITLPDSVLPGRYSAGVTFFNMDCGDITLPLTIDIFYPSSVLVQRWNDVIALRNSGYNGGYRFSDYLWYKDGEAVAGGTAPTLYLPGGALEFGAEYRMLLTRLDDGVSQFTCPIIPIEIPDGNLTDLPTIVFPGAGVELKSAEPADARLYNAGGQLVRSYLLAEGENRLAMPVIGGLYILHIKYGDGTVANAKIIIR